MITEEILGWINTLPKWEQKLGYYIIDKKLINNEILDDIYKIFKIENGIEEGVIDDSKINKIEINSNSLPNVNWVGVKNIHGVNKLSSKSKLDVINGMNLIYGENGSGKSGYTRLLNNAFISRGDQEILPNIYKDNVESISAEFAFLLDDKEMILRFPDDKEKYSFRTIRNYDSKSAANEMNKESVIDFAPTELSFFDALLNACIQIQTRLDNEIASKKIDNPLLNFFNEESIIWTGIGTLTHDTNIKDIEEKFKVNEDDKIQYNEIKKEKNRLIGLDINKQVNIMNSVIDELKKLQIQYDKFKNCISDTNINIYKQQIQFVKKCKLINEESGLSLFRNENIEKINSHEWKNFIQSGKKYYDVINNHASCPLCGQQLHKEDLIFKYWKYLDSDSENNLNVARQAIKLTLDSLKELDLNFLPDSSVYKQWLLDNFDKDTKDLDLFFAKAREMVNNVIQAIEKENDIELINNQIFINIESIIEKIEEKRNSLDQNSINKRIEECTILENNYTDKIKVIDLLPSINSYIDFLKWENKAISSRIKTSQITHKQKSLFDKYVTDDYINNFKKECDKLNANFSVEIVSRGSSGQTLKKLQIKGISPGKILSEGEQNAISIACFLTETTMDAKNKGIVFDDPVSSLDHKRRSYIVKRLVEEAKVRQVVIFTHDISFFVELKNEVEKNNINYLQQVIRGNSDETGFISQSIPWLGTRVNERIKILNNDLSEIELIKKSGDEDNYFRKAKGWCELLRESWERAVEEILLNDAIQRYDPTIQTQRLKKAPFNQVLYAELEQGMNECSSWCHDQARAIMNTPSISDLKLYIDHFRSFTKAHRPA